MKKPGVGVYCSTMAENQFSDLHNSEVMEILNIIFDCVLWAYCV